MDNKTKSDRIHELLPRILDSRNDEGWSAVVDAIGGEDDRMAALIENVRNQFFVKTASRPYLDRLAANSNISRPKFIGVGDTDFRRYIPVLSYQPKQVKQIVETLLDLFFFKEATTAFLSSAAYEPFNLKDGWDLQIKVDNIFLEHVVFRAADFSDIRSATAEELVAAYNRQAKFSYATAFYDSRTKHTYIRIFTNTIGNEGMLEIGGGLANISLELNGFLSELGTGANTQWTVSLIGDVVTFTHTGGVLPGVDRLEVGDIFLSDVPGNVGSFVIDSIDLRNSSFQFVNLFATPGVITQTASRQSKFLRPEKIVPYRQVRRALAWETKVGEIAVEMPATPAIVQRNLKGGFHLNGTTAALYGANAFSCQLGDASDFPPSGQFVVEPVNGIMARLTEDEVVTYTQQGRLISGLTRYSYTGKTNNTLTGITPDFVPEWTDLHECNITSAARLNGIMTCQGNNDFRVGERVAIRNSPGVPVLFTVAQVTETSPILTGVRAFTNVAPGQLVRGAGIPEGTRVIECQPLTESLIMSNKATATALTNVLFAENTNGSFILTACNPTSFSYRQLGLNGTVSSYMFGQEETGPGLASVERIGLWDAKVILTSARPAEDTKITGSYVWDPNAAFVLSSRRATTINPIIAGKTYKLLDVSPNDLPTESGYVVFDYGQNNQEGPVRYIYKPTENMLAFDASYIFQQSHDAGCSILAVNQKGAHASSGLANEYPPYITNPPAARLILQELIKSVVSAGIFIDFLIRYPTQLYGTLEVYD